LQYTKLLLKLKQEISNRGGAFPDLLKEEMDTQTLLRLLDVEIVCSAYMASEDFATLCLAFRERLEDLPLAVAKTDPKDIWKFFRAASSAPAEYFQRLWVYDDPSRFQVSDYERKLIEAVQRQNIEFLAYLVKQLMKFRGFYSTLHNKYKHGFPLFLGMRLAKMEPESNVKVEDVCSECLNLVIVASEELEPLRRPHAFILGSHVVDLSVKLHSISMHALEALLRSRLNWLRFNGWRNPPTVVYGCNPLSQEDWEMYERTVKLMIPEPLRKWPVVSKVTPMSTSVADLFRWIHSDDTKAHWLTAVPERFFFFPE
jgi:hypothetical protein